MIPVPGPARMLPYGVTTSGRISKLASSRAAHSPGVVLVFKRRLMRALHRCPIMANATGRASSPVEPRDTKLLPFARSRRALVTMMENTRGPTTRTWEAIGIQ
jgi:hypothetical protein